MTSTLRRIVRATCLAAALAGALSVPRAESATMSVDRVAVLGFLRAATPYTFEMKTAGMTQRLTFLNPRELRFEQGKARFKVDVRGEPVPVNAVLEPTMALSFDHQKGAFVAQIESLPVTMPGMGTMRLDSYIDPIIVPSMFSSPFNEKLPDLVVDTIVRDLKILDDRIEAKVDLIFRKAGDPPRQQATR
ncbi:MAG: hypothetical protein ACREAA_03615 [Candidatus Polarisedimenticolia bacterium]